MKIVKIENLLEGQILERPVVNDSGVVLIPSGTALKEDYIVKLIEIGLTEVFIRDEVVKEIEKEQQEIIFQECVSQVKDTIETYFSTDSSELLKIKRIANTIVDRILEIKEVLMNVNELRRNDVMKYNHSLSVTAMSVLIALKMGMDVTLVDEIALGCILHDIGYSVVNAKIKNNLSNEISIEMEREKKKHVLYGYNMIQSEKWIRPNSKDIILYHHERIDGSGYPFHRKDNQISIPTKIVSVCDEFDELVYEKKMKVHKAIELIISRGGVSLDLGVVKVFNEVIAAYPIGSHVITNNGDVGIVIRQNNKCPTRPVIKIIKKNNENVGEGKIEDLTQNLTLFIEDTIDIDKGL